MWESACASFSFQASVCVSVSERNNVPCRLWFSCGLKVKVSFVLCNAELYFLCLDMCPVQFDVRNISRPTDHFLS